MGALIEILVWVAVYSAIGSYTHGRIISVFKIEPGDDAEITAFFGAALWPIGLPVVLVKRYTKD